MVNGGYINYRGQRFQRNVSIWFVMLSVVENIDVFISDEIIEDVICVVDKKIFVFQCKSEKTKKFFLDLPKEAYSKIAKTLKNLYKATKSDNHNFDNIKGIFLTYGDFRNNDEPITQNKWYEDNFINSISYNSKLTDMSDKQKRLIFKNDRTEYRQKNGDSIGVEIVNSFKKTDFYFQKMDSKSSNIDEQLKLLLDEFRITFEEFESIIDKLLVYKKTAFNNLPSENNGIQFYLDNIKNYGTSRKTVSNILNSNKYISESIEEICQLNSKNEINIIKNFLHFIIRDDYFTNDFKLTLKELSDLKNDYIIFLEETGIRGLKQEKDTIMRLNIDNINLIIKKIVTENI